MRLLRTLPAVLAACAMLVLTACAQKELPPISESEFGVRTQMPRIITGTSDKSVQRQMLENCVPGDCEVRLSLSVSANNSLKATGEISADTIQLKKAGNLVIAGVSNHTIQVPAWNTAAAQTPLAPVVYTVTHIDAVLTQELLSTIPQDALYLALAGLSVEATFQLVPAGHVATEYVDILPPGQVPLVAR